MGTRAQLHLYLPFTALLLYCFTALLLYCFTALLHQKNKTAASPSSINAYQPECSTAVLSKAILPV
ncbi:hypothetical protein DOX43_18955 [Cronobacter malonaticus]|nr:hypothetical protein [Cronobacter malonaticus]EGT4485693.1 hypothetical protein [Cronobacter malonaticus]